MFDAPFETSRILIPPAERADVIVDFSGLDGRELVAHNRKLQPASSAPPPRTCPCSCSSASTPASPARGRPRSRPACLGPLPTFDTLDRERYITLEEVLDEDGEPIRSEIDGLRFHDPVNIQVPVGDAEDWILINLSADTHPIHLYLPQFQVIERRPLDVSGYQAALDQARAAEQPNPDPEPLYTGGPLPLQTDDRGFKDTVSANLEVVTRIRSPSTYPPVLPEH
jgi:spore coat protein A, manganese oxidase